jgi:hypothetical protein
MNTNTKKQAAAATRENLKTVTSRMIAPMQSIGRCGKSTFMQLIHHFLGESGIESAIIDLDEEHKTMKGWYPEVTLLPFRESQDLGRLFNFCGSLPVELMDFPAQATEEILKGFAAFNAAAIFAEKGIRLTVPIFASNESVAMQSAARIIQATSSFADYVIVRNPAKYESHLFEASRLMDMLNGAPVIEIPKLSPMTVTEIQNASRTSRKLLTFVEATEQVPIAARMEIKHWLNRCAQQIHSAKEFFVPDVSLVRNTYEELPTGAPKEKIDFFDL